MPQTFSAADTLAIKLIALGVVCLAAVAIGVARWSMSGAIRVDASPAQPIPFSHKHHVGDDGLDCRYCHTSVERSSFAGLPSTRICLTCHSQLYRDAPALARLHESAARNEPIAWTRVYDLPDFVYFDHSIHVAKGVGCIECHGRVDQMPVIRRAAPLEMQWCLDCHRNPGPHLRDPKFEFAMVPTQALPNRDEAKLVQGLQSTRRLTDCSTCHR